MVLIVRPWLLIVYQKSATNCIIAPSQNPRNNITNTHCIVLQIGSATPSYQTSTSSHIQAECVHFRFKLIDFVSGTERFQITILPYIYNSHKQRVGLRPF